MKTNKIKSDNSFIFYIVTLLYSKWCKTRLCYCTLFTWQVTKDPDDNDGVIHKKSYGWNSLQTKKAKSSYQKDWTYFPWNNFCIWRSLDRLLQGSLAAPNKVFCRNSMNFLIRCESIKNQSTLPTCPKISSTATLHLHWRHGTKSV